MTAQPTHIADDAQVIEPAKTGGRPDRSGREPAHTAAFSLVPREGYFEGLIALVGQTRIDGMVRGSLRGTGMLVLGPEARVEGAVECDVVSSRGVIIGPVVARIRAHFADGARFEGNLDAPAVEVDGDVVWNGVARVGC